MTETRLESWDARVPYLIAKHEQEQLELYQMDLIWLLTKRYYDNLPRPSDFVRQDRQDKRTAEQIKADMVKKLTAQG